MITRWQAVRGYPRSGCLNKLQHKALLGEVATTSTGDEKDGSSRRRSVRRSGGGPNPGAFLGGVVGGVMGGIFRH